MASSWVSSPFVKSSISLALCRRTVPLVSVWEMSIGQAKTPTLALRAFLIDPSGSRPNTMPLTTRDWGSEPPMILTTRMLSTLKLMGFLGRTARTASATRSARKSSLPDCLEATTVRMALLSSACDLRSLTSSTMSSVHSSVLPSPEIFCAVNRTAHTVQALQRLSLRPLVSLGDLTGLQPHP